jgi:hypothetical protein
MLRYDWNGQTRADEYVATFEEVHIYINGQSIARLSGSVPRVVIELVDGQSLLDLSALTTSEIEIFSGGKIDGQSNVFLRSEGQILFRNKIDGQSFVIACAGGGIEFGEINGQSQVLYSSTGPVSGPVLNGRSTVLWQGQAPNFAKIDGQSTVSTIPAFVSINCSTFRNFRSMPLQEESSQMPDQADEIRRTDREPESRELEAGVKANVPAAPSTSPEAAGVSEPVSNSTPSTDAPGLGERAGETEGHNQTQD